MTAEAIAPPGSRARQKAETKARILQCALDAFAERGFDGASVRDIAAAAGVNHGLIKYHFSDKDRLWKAAVDFLFERLHRELDQDISQADLSPLEYLKDWIRGYVHYCARHPEHARIMVQESIRDSDRLSWAVDKHIKPDHERFKPLNEAYMRKGIYPKITNYSMSYILVAASQTLFMLGPEVQRVYGVDVTKDDVIDAHADAIITLFFDHKAPPDEVT
ncbi:MAG: TetR/AcrR family transcriptional regulator [Henriciella sp.]|nr:TetR/AcrR family transcriptional regulator [Henriciella sp.]